MSTKRDLASIDVSSRGESPRRTALDALVRIENGAFAHILVPDVLRQLRFETRDRGLVTELVYGTVRMQRAVDYLIEQVSTRPLGDLDQRVRAALRLGTYQLLVGIPPYAAVAETVNLVSARARGFVNGVLRSVARMGPPWPLPVGDDIMSLGVRTSHPDWIVRLFVDEFGPADARATLELNDEPPPVTLRVNPMRDDPDELATELRALGIEVAYGDLVPEALLVRHSGDLAQVPAVRDGRVTPQDQASQAVVALLDPQPGDRVLDLASAPGGKSTAAAERMRGDGVVVAADLHPGRVRTVMRAVQRLNLAEMIVPLVANGAQPPVRDGAFDRVLLDAPCSGLGVLRRRPDARWRVRPGDVEQLATLQRELLLASARAVRIGGRLVYSVCTLAPAETREIDDWAATELPDFVAIAPPGAPWRPHGRGAIVLPSDAQSDGMFVLVLERRRLAIVPQPVFTELDEPEPEPEPHAEPELEPAPVEPVASPRVPTPDPTPEPPPPPPPRKWARVQ